MLAGMDDGTDLLLFAHTHTRMHAHVYTHACTHTRTYAHMHGGGYDCCFHS